MQWASKLLLDALRDNFVGAATLDLYRGTETKPWLTEIPVIGASITMDRGANVRRVVSAEIFMPYPDDPIDPFNPYSSRAQLYYGVELGGRTIEYVPMGFFRMESAERTSRNSLSVTGSSMEAFVVDDRFFTPRTPPKGSAIVNTVKSLITESVPNAQYVWMATKNGTVLSSAPWEKERWDAVTDLVESIGAECYTDAVGRFTIADAPDLNKPLAWVFNAGEKGVLVEYNRKLTRDGVYNVVVASGQSIDPAVPPVYATAMDDDPKSPTYYKGPFGRVPRFYSSEYLYTAAQCQTTAANLLVRSKIPNATIDFSGTPNPCLEPGDLVGIYYPEDMINEVHMIQTLSASFGSGAAAWKASTYSAVMQTGDVEGGV